MSLYTIRLTNCAFFARHGVHDEEEFLGQRFFVDAVLQVDPGDTLKEDSVDGTVDYGVVFVEIQKIVTGKRHYLIEALAYDVARALCRRFAQIRHVSITVRKPNAPVPGILDHVSVTVDYDA